MVSDPGMVPTPRFVKLFSCLMAGLVACAERPDSSTPAGSADSVFVGPPSIVPTPALTFSIPDSIGGASADMGRAVRLASGRVAIGDWEGKRVLVFDSLGRLDRVIGRAGSGPGEYQGPTLIQSFGGDSLLVWDAYLRRVSWLSG